MELLQRAGRRTGVMTMMAKRLGVHRATLWRHKKEHLKIFVSKLAPKTKDLSFEERARFLGGEADRLQCQCENGAPEGLIDQAMKALALRVKLLELESRLSGRPVAPPKEVLDDPAEGERVQREYAEVVGAEE